MTYDLTFVSGPGLLNWMWYNVLQMNAICVYCTLLRLSHLVFYVYEAHTWDTVCLFLNNITHNVFIPNSTVSAYQIKMVTIYLLFLPLLIVYQSKHPWGYKTNDAVVDRSQTKLTCWSICLWVINRGWQHVSPIIDNWHHYNR